MKSDSLPVERYLPALSDDAVIEVREFLHNLSLFFSSQYRAQIQRYYEEHEFDNLAQPRFFADPPDFDDEPF
jgi:hypothetical protein